MESCTYQAAAFDFIGSLEAAPNADAILDRMQAVLAPYGIDRLIMTGLPERNMADAVLATRWPEEFFCVYNRKDWIRVDPLARRTRASLWPFKWNASILAGLDPEALELMHCAAEFGIAEGFVAPIQGPRGLKAAVSMSGSKLELPDHLLPSIHLIALSCFDRVHRHRAVWRKADRLLTARESEVLTWVAQGKTAWEIGQILSIAKRTVDEHVLIACRKVGAANRTQAVAIAIRDRLISL
jgi:LuxR family quorum sensing-dependent transcriptional regulator